MKVLLIGDTHITDDVRRPSSRKPGYEQQVLDKLAYCVEAANDKSLPIIQNGDLFNLKAAGKNSHGLVQRVHEIFDQANNGVAIVPGNHDLAFDRLDSLPSQPLGALCRMRNVELLIGKNDALPGIAGIPYTTQFDGGDWQSALKQKNNYDADNVELIITHAPIFPIGQEPGVYASITPNDWASYFPDVPFCSYGHIHDFHGKHYNQAKSTLFSNAGAISRGSLHEQTINRQPKYTIFTGSDFEFYNIPCAPSEEIFLFDEADIKKLNKVSAAEFASAVGQVSLHSLTLEEIYATLRGEVTNPDVMQVIERVLENVQ